MTKFQRAVIAFVIIYAFIIPSVSVLAAESSTRYQYEQTNVLDDLMSSGTFDAKYYPPDENGKISVIQFVEFAYSPVSSNQNDFGLYVYVYNPAFISIDTDADNYIQMACGFDNDFQANDYKHFSLRFCNKSTGSYNNLYYKFFVADDGGTYDMLLENLNAVTRYYCVSGITLYTEGSNEAPAEIGVYKTYAYSGYAKGYGLDADVGDLTCEASDLETVSINVNHTYYRTLFTDKPAGYQNQLNSIYFTIPADTVDKYDLNGEGVLQRIKAQWYTYQMKPAVITSNDNLYNYILSRIGNPVSGSYSDLAYSVFSDYSAESYPGEYIGGSVDYFYDWGWSVPDSYMASLWSYTYSGTKTETLYNVFKVNSIEYENNRPVSGFVSSNTVSNWVYNYAARYSYNGDLILNRFPSVLFEDGSSDANEHFTSYDFDVDELKFAMPSYNDQDPTFWDKARDFGFWHTLINAIPSDELLNNSYEDMAPIVPVYYNNSATDKNDGINDMTDAEISEALLINETDADEIKYLAQNCEQSGDKTYILRFALSDYYSTPLYVRGLGGNSGDYAYMAKQTAYLDFDVIQFTFKVDGEYFVVPVVTSPTDALAGYSPPSWQSSSLVFGDLSKFLSSLFVIFALCVVLFPFLPFIINAGIWVITLPFKMLNRVFSGFSKTASKGSRYAKRR